VVRPYYASAAFPCVYPPGYYTNSYYFPWYYPWYANYNYAHGPYSNWWWWGGYATYGGCCTPRPLVPVAAAAPTATVTVSLPADAKLWFNGVEAPGTGATRSFATPPLAPGMEYAYELTAEATRKGAVQKITQRVVVRAGQEATVDLVDFTPKK
jgi:uncharacterized protein (TIGR03000 family)